MENILVKYSRVNRFAHHCADIDQLVYSDQNVFIILISPPLWYCSVASGHIIIGGAFINTPILVLTMLTSLNSLSSSYPVEWAYWLRKLL